MKQKSIEQFLGVHREDKYNGGQLIDVYREYLHTHEKFLFDLLILHNADDLQGNAFHPAHFKLCRSV